MAKRGWGPVVRSAAIVAAMALLAAGCSADRSPPVDPPAASEADPSSPLTMPEPSATPATVTEGYASATYAPDVFPAGVVPRADPLDVSEIQFANEFGLPSPDGQVAAVSFTASTQPQGDVQVGFLLDPDSVPDGTIPAVFYREDFTGLWLPIPSTYAEDGTLVGVTDHFTDFLAAFVSGLEAVEDATQWLRFQVAKGVGARGGSAECGGDWPDWLLNLEVEDGLNAPLRACAEGTEDELTLRVVTNRAYSLILDGPAGPGSAEYSPSLDTDDVLYSALAGSTPFRFGDDVLAPARMMTSGIWARDSIGPGKVVINGRVNPATLALDGFIAAAGVLVGLVYEPGALLLDAGSCLQGAFDTAFGSGEEAVGNLVSAATDCLEPMTIAAGGAATTASKKVLKAVEVSLLMGRGAQSVLDGAAALNESHSLSLLIAEELGAPPDNATLLSDLRTKWEGDGPTGDAADVTIGTFRAPQSSTQWVGCEGTPAYGDFDLGGRTLLTGLLGKRDFTPEPIEARVDVFVDGKRVTSYKVDDEPIRVSLDLPAGGKTLRLASIVTAGRCTSAPAGYFAWGNGALQ